MSEDQERKKQRENHLSETSEAEAPLAHLTEGASSQPSSTSVSSTEPAVLPSEIFRPDLLSNLKVLVTGGGSGIGYAIAEECARLGAYVHIGGRNIDRLRVACEQLNASAYRVGITDERVSYAQLNIRDEETCIDWTRRAVDTLGGVDVLINNAGGQFPSPAEMIKPKGWRAVIDTNLNGTFWMTQAAAKHMIKAKQGQIINIVANMWRGFPGMAHTGAARAGVVNLTKTLSLEWSKYQVRVNAVAPGVIQSSGLDTYPKMVQEMLTKEVPAQIPLQRLGTVEDVAWAVVYLLSPAGSYITGETICVDGGQAHWGMAFPIR
jgi:citronellol/citronellal dehydrogenase